MGAASPPFSSKTASPMATVGLRHACPTYKKFHHPLNDISQGFTIFFTGRCIFLYTHPQPALLQLKSIIFCLSPMAMVTMLITVEIKLSSAVADADCSLLSRWASLAKPAESTGSKSGEVRHVRYVEVGVESIRSSILTGWRQSKRRKWSPKSSRIR